MEVKGGFLIEGGRGVVGCGAYHHDVDVGWRLCAGGGCLLRCCGDCVVFLEAAE